MDIRVQNLRSFGGNEIPIWSLEAQQHFEIFTKDAVYFQSYGKIIVKKTLKDGQVYLDRKHWGCSPPNFIKIDRYRQLYLRESVAETDKKIGSGEYKVVDLN